MLEFHKMIELDQEMEVISVQETELVVEEAI